MRGHCDAGRSGVHDISGGKAVRRYLYG